MSQSKQAFVRYQALDRCFCNFSKSYRIDDLVIEVNRAVADYLGDLYKPDFVSKRTVQSDIKYMVETGPYKIPLVRTNVPLNKREVTFRYSDPDFSINKRPISQQEMKLMREAMETLRTFKGLPQFEWIDEASARIDKWTSEKENKAVAILFDTNIDLKGKEHIQLIYYAIRNKSSLTIAYQPFNEEKQTHKISPYLLKQYNNRWFVLGLSDHHDFVIHLALDRIEEIHQGKHPYQEYPEDSPEEFFENIVGVTRLNKPVEKVEVLVRSDLFPYVATKPIHSTQKGSNNETNEEWVKITIEIIPNYEFYSIILSHGFRIKIIGPEKVKQDFMKIVNQTYSQYF